MADIATGAPAPACGLEPAYIATVTHADEHTAGRCKPRSGGTGAAATVTHAAEHTEGRCKPRSGGTGTARTPQAGASRAAAEPAPPQR